MDEKDELMLVSSAVLPKVFLKVVEAKKLLSEGVASTINNAAHMAGISRSAFYKYKDYVFPFFEMANGQIFTLFFIVYDVPGVLSGILKAFAEQNANILTINQNIPVNNIANITISFKLDENIGDLIETLKTVHGVKKIDIIAKG